jgi:hypothetical protein
MHNKFNKTAAATKIAAAHSRDCENAIDLGFAHALRDKGIKDEATFNRLYKVAVDTLSKKA